VPKKILQKQLAVHYKKWGISRKGLFHIALNFPTKDGQRKAFAVYLLSIDTYMNTIHKDMGISLQTLLSWVERFNNRGPSFFAEAFNILEDDVVDEKSGLVIEDPTIEDYDEDSEDDIIVRSKGKLKDLREKLKEVTSTPIMSDDDVNDLVDNRVNEYLKHNGQLKRKAGRPPKNSKDIKKLPDYTIPSIPKDVNALALRVLRDAINKEN
jgi:hypothetical protein